MVAPDLHVKADNDFCRSSLIVCAWIFSAVLVEACQHVSLGRFRIPSTALIGELG